VPISDIPIFSMLRTKMHWHQERQRLLAENVANADTPKFMPRDLVPVDVTKPQPSGLTLARTSTALLTQTGGDSLRFRARSPARFRSEALR